MSLLTMIGGVTARLSLGRTTVVATATDATVLNLLALAQEEGKELARNPWQQLRKEFSFTTVAAEAQTSSLPSDLGMFVNDTAWNRSRMRPLIGPLSPEEWQRIKAMSSNPAADGFTIRQNAFRMLPVPTAGQSVYYEYISNQWCESSGGTDQSAWAADTDTGILSEDLMALGIIWRYKKGRGMSWDVEYQQYEAWKNDLLGISTMRSVVPMGGGVGRPTPPGLYAPEGSWFT